MPRTHVIAALVASGCSSNRPPADEILFVSHASASFREVEPTLAVSQDGRSLAVAWMGQSPADLATGLFPAYGHIGYAMSIDGGATWTEPGAIPTPGPGGGTTKFSIDPELAIDGAGTVHLAYATRQTGDEFGNENVFYARATPPEPLAGSFDLATMQGIDRPWIHVAPSGAILVTYTAVDGLVAATSRDGTRWTPTLIPGTENGGVAVLCEGAPAERVHAALLLVATDGTLAVALATSRDGGATWAATATTVSLPGEAVAFDPPTCAAAGDDVWVTYGLTHDGIDLGELVFPRLDAIQLAHSADAGATIAARFPALDTAFPFAMHPRVALTPDGTPHVAYYAGRDRGDAGGELRRARLPRGADALAPSVTVAAPIAYDTVHSGPAFVGDFLDMTFSGTSLIVAYGDNSSGASHITIRRLEAP